MVNKKLINKNVVRALSVGLAVAMASQPITANAQVVFNEGEGDRLEAGEATHLVPVKTDEENLASEAQKTKEAVEIAEREIYDNNDENNSEAEKYDGISVKEATEAVSEQKDNIFDKENPEGKDSRDVVVEKSEEATTEPEGKKASELVEDAITQFANMDSEKRNLSKAQSEEVTSVLKSNGVASELLGDLQEKEEDVDKLVEKVQKSETPEEVNKALEEVRGVVLQAKDEYEEKSRQYNEALGNYEAAKTAQETAIYNYTTAKGTAVSDITEASKKMKDAQEALNSLETELNKAEEAMHVAKALELIAEEERTKIFTKWKDYDALFESMIKDYYVPSVGGSDATLEWDRTYNETLGDKYNFCKVTYKDADGQDNVKYLNYVLEDKKNNDCSLLIFEKTEEKVTEDENVKIANVESPDFFRITYEENGVKKTEEFAGEDLVNKLNSGELVEVGGKYYKALDEGETTTNELNLHEKNNGSARYITPNKKEQVVYSIDDNKNLIKSVYKSVTTDEYGFEAGATYKNISVDTTTLDETWYDYLVSSSYAEAEELKAKNAHDDDYVLSKEGGFSSDYTGWHGDWIKHMEWNVNGTVVVRYLATTTSSESYSFGNMMSDVWNRVVNFFGGDKDVLEDELTREVSEEVAKSGGKFVSFEALNWNTKTAKIKYIAPDGTEKTKSYYSTAEDAMAAAKASAESQGKYVLQTSANEVIVSSKSEDELAQTTEYKNIVRALKGMNLKTNSAFEGDRDANTMIDADDEEGLGTNDYVNWKEAAKNYYELKKQVSDAKSAVDDAQTLLEVLNGKLEELKLQERKGILLTNNDERITLEELLENAKNNKKLADEAYMRILSKQIALENSLIKVIPSGDDRRIDDDRRTVVLEEEPAVETAQTPATVRRAAAPAAVEELVTIETPETALAATVEEATEEPEVLDIEMPETALAATPVNEEAISWWWLLIIAVLGATGYAMYKKHQEKKAEKIDE